MKKVLMLSSMVFIAQAQNGSQLAIEQQQMLQAGRGSVSVKNALNPVINTQETPILQKALRSTTLAQQMQQRMKDYQAGVARLYEVIKEKAGINSAMYQQVLNKAQFDDYQITCPPSGIYMTQDYITSFENPAYAEIAKPMPGAPVRCYVRGARLPYEQSEAESEVSHRMRPAIAQL